MRVKTLTIPTMGLIALLALPAWAQDTKDASSLRADVVSPDGLTREEMTTALVTALGFGDYTPPDCVAGQEMFDDVPASSLFCPWIEELVRRGITEGCGGDNYCPAASVTRAQMAAFLVKTQFPTSVPLGVTVTGRWGFDVDTDGGGDWGASISYPASTFVSLTPHYLAEGDPSTDECPGNPNFPAAAPGHVCVYEQLSVQATFASFNGTSRFGTTVYFFPDAAGDMYAHGSWAATVPRSIE